MSVLDQFIKLHPSDNTLWRPPRPPHNSATHHWKHRGGVRNGMSLSHQSGSISSFKKIKVPTKTKQLPFPKFSFRHFFGAFLSSAPNLGTDHYKPNGMSFFVTVFYDELLSPPFVVWLRFRNVNRQWLEATSIGTSFGSNRKQQERIGDPIVGTTRNFPDTHTFRSLLLRARCCFLFALLLPKPQVISG